MFSQQTILEYLNWGKFLVSFSYLSIWQFVDFFDRSSLLQLKYSDTYNQGLLNMHLELHVRWDFIFW